MKMKKFFLLLLLFLPRLVWAQTTGPGFNVLNPSAIRNGTDYSISYLQDIFGVVDGVLHGSGSQILGQMFGIFNAAALALGGIIILYTLMLSTLNTAHEGEVLGKKWSSMWIPLRSALGIGLLLPKATGYSVIQIFVMWAIVQGVGAADSIWDAALNYLAGGGVIVQQELVPSSGVATQAKNIFSQEVCLYAVQQALNQAQIDYNQNNSNTALPPVPILSSTVTPFPTNPTCPGGSANTPCVSIPGNLSNYDTSYQNLTGICGNITWTNPNIDTNSSALSGSGLSASAVQQILLVRQTAIQQMVLDLGSPAQIAVNSLLRIGNNTAPINNLVTSNNTGPVNNRIFLAAAEDYQGIMTPLLSAMQGGGGVAAAGNFISDAKTKGWIMAGSYYQNLANVNDVLANIAFKSLPTAMTYNQVGDLIGATTNGGNLLKALPGFAQNPQYASAVASLFNQSTDAGQQLNNFINQAPTTDSNYGNNKIPLPNITSFGSSWGAGQLVNAAMFIVSPLLNGLVDLMSGVGGLATAQMTNANPVVMISMIGNGLIMLVAEIWLVGATSFAAVSGALGAVPCLTLPDALNSVLMWVLPFLWAIIGLLFIEGAIMVFYVPLIPFIIYLFTAIGWIIAVIEAMVAAPIVALGITHPEGHEVLGKADPAVLLLVNVFLRPSMMVIGLIAGIILSYVGVWLLNDSLFSSGMVTSMLSNVQNPLAWLLLIPVFLILYLGLVIAVLNQAFSLIHVIPDKVMRWLSAPSEMSDAERHLQAVRSGMEGGMRGIEGGAKTAAQASGQRADERRAKSAAGSGESTAKGGGAPPPVIHDAGNAPPVKQGGPGDVDINEVD